MSAFTSPRRVQEYSPIDGPSPSRKVGGKRKRRHPNTVDREASRQSALRALVTKRENQRKRLNFSDLAIKRQMDLFESLKENEPLKSLVSSNLLKERLSHATRKSTLRKCFSVCQVVLFEKEASGEIRTIRTIILPETSWSSYRDRHKNDTLRLIGVRKKNMRSVTKKKTGTFPLLDHHSERAYLQFLIRNLQGIVKKLSRGIELSSKHIVQINILTSYSSCHHCASIFGVGERVTRVTDALRESLLKGDFIVKGNAPHVSLVHKGKGHYHPSTRGGSTPTVSEFFCSSSML